jgi:hypothetical protein
MHLRDQELQAIDQCPDKARCFMERRGLPICRKTCSVMTAYRDPVLWRNIQALAEAGNPASNDIVKLIRAAQ